ncbi:MAG: cellulose synthase complex periplasmic endoglucanase BcsZ [Pararobbsia sp.]
MNRYAFACLRAIVARAAALLLLVGFGHAQAVAVGAGGPVAMAVTASVTAFVTDSGSGSGSGSGGGAAGGAAANCAWPQYDAWLAKIVQPDGRAVDFDTKQQQTTSESQSYAMFFALVANDRASFDRVLQWTRANLAGGRFGPDEARLPAWQWGRRQDGSFGVLDPNSAADSDLWIAYDLFEAGRLWHESGYTETARALLSQIRAHETVELAGLGPVLLPGAQGFFQDGLARLNPSYTPVFVLRRLAQEDPQGPWNAIAANTAEMIRIVSPRGFVPDWVGFRVGQGFVVDPVEGAEGGYDAIRVYLWAALLPARDPLAARLLGSLGGMRTAIDANGAPPERVDTTTGEGQGAAPVGFWGALWPYLRALDDPRAATLAQQHLAGDFAQARYYDRALSLFGAGAAEARYRFDLQGWLQPAVGGGRMPSRRRTLIAARCIALGTAAASFAVSPYPRARRPRRTQK